MGRYFQSDYEDPNEPRWWEKVIGLGILCGLVWAGLWVARHWPF